MTKSLRARFAKVKLLLCDVDGVLTDGCILLGSGREVKKFHIRDGLGLRILSRAGIRVGWISNRPSPATSERARELKIDYVHQGAGSKVDVARGMMAQAGVTWTEVCYVGDDIVDLAMVGQAGVGVAVANAVEELKAQADYVTQADGGNGAVREVVEAILSAQSKWSGVVGEYAIGTPPENGKAMTS